VTRVTRVGVISDTHGLLRPEAVAFLRGSDRIVHAGDVGDPAILDELARIAPVTAVRGNVDTSPWAAALPETASLEVEGVRIHVLHVLAQLDVLPAAARIRVVVSGHSHKPLSEHRGGVLYLNPGSAGPRRFTLPISIAELTIADGAVEARIVELAIA
jgi:putative phosphoesterase